ncbi:MAG: gliding motility protein GldN, partial [Catalinimonas sp.]
MSNTWKCLLAAGGLLFAAVGEGRAQASDYGEDGYNHNSVRPIHESDIMYRMGLWRRMNLNNPVNAPFFADGNEITKIMIDAVKQGRLVPYTNDSLNTPMTKDEFIKAITMEDDGFDAAPADDFGGGDNFGGGGWGDEPAAKDDGFGQEAPVAISNEYFASDLYLLELREDLIFDKTRSRMYFDMLAISIVLPAEKNVTNLEKKIATFKYKDLVEVFEQTPNAKWYNTANRAEDKNLSDAFDLRLFHSYIVKMSNPRDQMLADIYTSTPEAGLIAAQQMEHRI